MNNNVFLGIVCFVLWSIFSTWFYVNHIKEFNAPLQKELTTEPVKKTDPVVQALPEIELSKAFTFHKNTADLIHPEAIRQFTDSLRSALTDRTVSVSIIGHTCDLGTDDYNMKLGQKRADFVMKALKESNINWPQLTSTSKGESSPVVSNTSETNRIKNRRVTILINSKL
jgi:outer membrane protein OmpA-like peptidoglycan-associated protein